MRYRRLLAAASLCALLSPITSQAMPKDAMVVVATADFFGQNSGKGGGMFYVSPDRLTFTRITGHSKALFWCNCATIDSQTGFLFVGTLNKEPAKAGNIYRVFLNVQQGGKVVTVVLESKITKTAPDSGSISGITLRGNKVWYATDGGGSSRGRIGFVPKTGGNPTNVLAMQNPPVTGLGQAITSNGREIFVGVSASASSTANLYSLDPDTLPLKLKPITLAGATSLGQLTMGAGGQVFASDFRGFGHLIDPLTGKVNTVNTIRAPQFSAHAGVLNPWTHEWAIGPGFSSATPREIHIYNLVKNQWTTKAIGTAGVPGFPTGIASNHERPFDQRGKGCPGANKKEPRIGSSALARVGKSFDLTLRDATPRRPAVLLVGLKAQSIDLGTAGAPGCTLLVAPIVGVGLPVSSSGTAKVTIPVPNDPSLSGATVQAQWAIGSGVNALGVVSSDGGTLRVR